MLIPADVLLAFFAASVALAIAPGPDNIFVLTQSAVSGRVTGVMITLGLCTGLVIHTTAVALGVAAVFQTSAAAFTVLKFVGAGYLMYLAWQAFRSSVSEISTDSQVSRSYRRLYLRGIIMNVTNPKVALFFLAFLPQFADPARGSLVAQIFVLGAVFIVAALLVFVSVAMLAGAIGEWLNRSERVQRTMNRIAGAVFAGLALKLLTSVRSGASG